MKRIKKARPNEKLHRRVPIERTAVPKIIIGFLSHNTTLKWVIKRDFMMSSCVIIKERKKESSKERKRETSNSNSNSKKKATFLTLLDYRLASTPIRRLLNDISISISRGCAWIFSITIPIANSISLRFRRNGRVTCYD